MLLIMPVMASAGDIYKGREFWLAWLQSEVGRDNFEISLHITAQERTSVTVRLPAAIVDSRGEREWTETYKVGKGEVLDIVIPAEYTLKTRKGKSTNKGLYIVADEDIMVVAKNSSGSSSDATVVIPINGLGTEYYAMQYNVMRKDYPTQYLVLATEDSTVVDIVNVNRSSDTAGPHQQYSILLNKGDYHVVNSVKDLTGSTIKSRQGKKIAVFSGNTCAYVPSYCQSCDHLYEQMSPVNTWGHEFVVMPFDTRVKYVVRILAKEDRTYVYVDGQKHEIAKAGKYLELELSEAAYVTTSRDVLVCQYTIGTRCDENPGDPSMVMMKPVLSYSGENILPIMQTLKIRDYYITVLIKTKDIPLFTINGKTKTKDFTEVSYRSEYSYAHIQLSTRGTTVKCDCEYNFISYGLGWFESYAY
ncbi:MAG TPA: IgGFc-binding protein [Bacteroidia bacterium]|nr:IgGFc-binding protein [Bacteroidia bacterium]